MNSLVLRGALFLMAVFAATAMAGNDSNTDRSGPAGRAVQPRAMMPSNPGLLQQLSENTRIMTQQMDALEKADDPKRRAQILQEHRVSMEDQLRLIQTLVGRGPLATGMGPGSPMDRRMSALEQRVELLQEMMSQMLKHQEQLSPKPDKK